MREVGRIAKGRAKCKIGEKSKLFQQQVSLPEVEGYLEMTQEIQANNAINAMLLRDGVSQGFNILYPGITPLPSPSLVCHQYRLRRNDDIEFCLKIRPA